MKPSMRLSINTCLLQILLLLFASEFCTAEQSSTNETPSQQFGCRIEEIFSQMKSTDYSHSTKIDLNRGILQCDCSGFLDFVLREEFPEHYVSLRGVEQPTRRRPLAVTFYETFTAANSSGSLSEASCNAWHQVSDVRKTQPGDILAWRKKTIRKGSTTGHVCMIASSPTEIGTNLIQVRLIDSTRSPHTNDTRTSGKTGVGSGLRTFLIDENGAPLGSWIDGKCRETQIAIGRMTHLRFPSPNPADKKYIGLETAKATKIAESTNTKWQIIREDQRPKELKWAIHNDRISFVIVDGKVTMALRG